MNRLSRSTALKIAAVFSCLLGVYGLIDALPYLARGAAGLNQEFDSPPYLVIVLGFAFSIIGIIAAYGAWRNQRWGVVLTLLTNALNTLLAVPGIFFAPTTYFWYYATLSTALGIVVIVLCLWRERRPALA